MPTIALDPRITRTRHLLQAALLDLAGSRPFESISVADVADSAGVNRSTFYQHYANKEVLLADALDAQAATAGADLSELETPSFDLGGPPPALVLRYAQHVSENAELYRQALGEHGSTIAVVRLRHRIASVAASGFAMFSRDEADLGMPIEIAASSIAGSLLGILSAWLESADPAPPELVAAWIWSALSPRAC